MQIHSHRFHWGFVVLSGKKIFFQNRERDRVFYGVFRSFFEWKGSTVNKTKKLIKRGKFKNFTTALLYSFGRENILNNGNCVHHVQLTIRSKPLH